eukprot:Amastigsp_a346564_16.p3 type:complete len:106 gc:universal Amastigsp_a346564_16:488-171(-)
MDRHASGLWACDCRDKHWSFSGALPHQRGLRMQWRSVGGHVDILAGAAARMPLSEGLSRRCSSPRSMCSPGGRGLPPWVMITRVCGRWTAVCARGCEARLGCGSP